MSSHDENPFEKLGLMTCQIGSKGAQLSNDNWRQYLPMELDKVDKITTMDSTVAYVYVDMLNASENLRIKLERK